MVLPYMFVTEILEAAALSIEGNTDFLSSIEKKAGIRGISVEVSEESGFDLDFILHGGKNGNAFSCHDFAQGATERVLRFAQLNTNRTISFDEDTFRGSYTKYRPRLPLKLDEIKRLAIALSISGIDTVLKVPEKELAEARKGIKIFNEVFAELFPPSITPQSFSDVVEFGDRYELNFARQMPYFSPLLHSVEGLQKRTCALVEMEHKIRDALGLVLVDNGSGHIDLSFKNTTQRKYVGYSEYLEIGVSPIGTLSDGLSKIIVYGEKNKRKLEDAYRVGVDDYEQNLIGANKSIKTIFNSKQVSEIITGPDSIQFLLVGGPLCSSCRLRDDLIFYKPIINRAFGPKGSPLQENLMMGECVRLVGTMDHGITVIQIEGKTNIEKVKQRFVQQRQDSEITREQTTGPQKDRFGSPNP